MATRASVSTFLYEELQLRSLALYALVFLSCFLTAKFGQYLFFEQNTSPALIWPPFGIALGAILLGGYRMWLPVALAELLAVFSAGISPLPVMLAATIGQTLQPLAAAWALNWIGFDLTLARARDAFFFIGITFLATTIAPTLSSLAQLLITHHIVSAFSTVWTRSWAAGILSIFVLTPLITVWFPLRKFDLTRAQIAEAILALLILVGTLLATWTTLFTDYGLTDVYIILAVLVWISVRTEPRILTLSLLILTVLGMGGSFLHLSSTPLNQTLFGQELFIEFLAVIYLVFTALIEERRRGRLALESSVEQLQKALEKIEREDVAKNQFIATLAHELRNPLAPVVSALDFLALQNPSGDMRETIEGAQRELSLMRRLLDDILDVARVAQTRFKLQREIIDIRPLIERCVESTKTFLRTRGHTLTFTLPQDSVMLDVDPVRFQQIVVNLLNNAGKYTKQGGKIELMCEKVGSTAIIQVSDSGIGIPQEMLKEIFEPFRQIRPTPQMGTGLGIGLWLTKRLVEIHGGTIEARSEGPERGSRFILRFPLKDGVQLHSGGGMTSKVLIPSMKVLIVDDNEAAAQAMQKLLKLKGHEARIAYSGVSALSTASEYQPQVVLLDVGLPDMSGYDVARLLRGQGSKTTLIALTGYGQDEDKENAKRAGFDFHLTKPIGIADLEAVFGQLTH